MIRVKLMSILVNDQQRARRFYTDVLGFSIKHDIPLGEAAWLTLVAPDDPDGVELLLEPTGHPAAVALQKRSKRMAFGSRNSIPTTSPPNTSA